MVAMIMLTNLTNLIKREKKNFFSSLIESMVHINSNQYIRTIQ